MVLSLPAAELRCIIDFLPWWIRLSNTARTSYICGRKKYKRRQMFAMAGVDSICLCSPPLPRLIHTELPTWFPITYISPALDRVDFLSLGPLEEYGAEETENGNPLPCYFISWIFYFHCDANSTTRNQENTIINSRKCAMLSKAYKI